ncbi:MAG: BrnT family toxin [Proteobacteria bacterium]|jgi:uncharacterized DUF497 family protein|nr:BrnT family toxin [Pseudomonadota bacterium]
MEFEWAENKNRANVKKHKLSFEESKEIFDDPFHISIIDERFSNFEERWVTIGTTYKGKLIVAGHLYCLKENGEEVIRIISARKATKKEKEQYETIGF